MYRMDLRLNEDKFNGPAFGTFLVLGSLRSPPVL